MDSEGKIKHLWRGVFNFNHYPEVIYRQAYTKKQAWVVMCRALAKRHGVVPQMVMNKFNGDRDNYEISIEVEWRKEAIQ
ncbi:MAG: hypothetical protein Q8P24_02090 [Desulfobacterales bacterium]|nr:hypothetical protein [Desulfobacterales bacterium]